MAENPRTTQLDSAEVSWVADKRKWLVRIQAGEEVIRRYFDASKDTDEQTLRLTAQNTVQDEGYEADLARIVIAR